MFCGDLTKIYLLELPLNTHFIWGSDFKQNDKLKYSSNSSTFAND